MTTLQLYRCKYLLALIIPVGVLRAVHTDGVRTLASLYFLMIIIPVIELILPSNTQNLSAAEEAMAEKSPIYDWFLYIQVPILYGLLFYSLHHIATAQLSLVEYVGNITAAGIMCGALGINVAHELGHRHTRLERLLAKLLLLPALYMHFHIEHNYGHHKYVATRRDPASARYGEHLYRFWLRSVTQSYLSAWAIQRRKLHKAALGFWSVSNEMLLYHVSQCLFVSFIWIVYGFVAVLAFLCSACIAVLLLETTNYIEHYGLERALSADGEKYEKTTPAHSWNSSHVLSRLLLFELLRHSDHH